ncbi:MAG: HD-GYP domain-containing protein, partial [Gemmataceae bacterium]
TPDGPAGEPHPRPARNVAVADAFDATTSDRPYRKGMASEAAFEEVEKQAGKQFDPECAAAFLAIRERIVEEMNNQSAQAPAVTKITKALQAS